MRKITYQQLVQANACSGQRVLFKKLFGISVVPTEALAREHGHLFDATFAARHFLSSSLLEEYNKAHAPLLEQYEKARDSLWKQYEKAHAPLGEQYLKASAPLWEQYKTQCMLEFVRLYQQWDNHA